MSNWSKTVTILESITFRVSTSFGHGTGFLVHQYDGTLTIATAWHIIEGLSKIVDKHARAVELLFASDGTVIHANAVGVARLGSALCDVGVVWIGKPFSQSGVDRLLAAVASIGLRGGHLDVSGGGGIFHITGGSLKILKLPKCPLIRSTMLMKGQEVGWLGFPSFASS